MMTANQKLGWELLGFGLIVGGPVVGMVIVSNKSPGTWVAVWSVTAKMLKR